MSDKEKQAPKTPETEAKEPILDFEEAKDMTVGQAVRKSEEIEAGVTDEDSVLDKYIKQHKEEILAGKFDTVHGDGNAQVAVNKSETPKISEMNLEPTSLDDFIQEIRSEETSNVENQDETIVLPSAEEVIANHRAVQEAAEPAHTHAGYDEVPLVDEKVVETASAESTQAEESSIIPGPIEPVRPVDPQPVFTSEVEYQWDKEVPLYKRKSVLYTSLGLLAVAIAGSALYWGMFRNNGATTASSQASTSSTSATSTSSSEDTQKAFDDLYASFFTDDQQTALKNSAFGNLENLKTALDKLEGSSGYDAAKKKYDDLVTQISAIQSVNGQFTTAAITDGVVDSNAQAKSDAVFKDTTTGNAAVDKVLSQAIQQGRSQTIPAPGPVQAAPATTTPVVPQNPAPAQLNIQNAGVPGFGLSSAGVNLQRNLSRVPYNQEAINDVNNPAWTFNPGVIEKILQTARERGHITGDQYILEKVNIINGNGYYNLFKPDGTYLFSINAKTGYFVGNGRGHADALDY